jgi:hypothetical protein
LTTVSSEQFGSLRQYENAMAIELDHVIVSARNQRVSTKRLADLLGVRWAETGAGPFSPVYVNDGLTLDFIDYDGPFPIQHFCFQSHGAFFTSYGCIAFLLFIITLHSL